MWIIAMMVGFVIWWPIGATILAAITLVAITQQLTGQSQQPQPQPEPLRYYEPLPPLYYDASGKRIESHPMKQVQQTKRLQITDQRKRKS
jgi:hypothetical protein